MRPRLSTSRRVGFLRVTDLRVLVTAHSRLSRVLRPYEGARQGSGLLSPRRYSEKMQWRKLFDFQSRVPCPLRQDRRARIWIDELTLYPWSGLARWARALGSRASIRTRRISSWDRIGAHRRRTGALSRQSCYEDEDLQCVRSQRGPCSGSRESLESKCILAVVVYEDRLAPWFSIIPLLNMIHRDSTYFVRRSCVYLRRNPCFAPSLPSSSLLFPSWRNSRWELLQDRCTRPRRSIRAQMARRATSPIGLRSQWECRHAR